MKLLKIFFPLFALLFLNIASAQELKITTIDWAPYTGKDLPGQGTAIKAFKALAEKAGVNVTFEFRPTWEDAVETSKKDGYDGFYPGWPEDVIKGYFGSKDIFLSPIGFAELKSFPTSWKNLDDLKDKKIIIVKDYAYPKELTDFLAKGTTKIIKANSDIESIKMLALGTGDLFVVDPFVLFYLIDNNKDLNEYKNKIVFNSRPIKMNGLTIVLKDNAKNREIQKALEEALKVIDVQSIINQS
jgi:polar amino acid transport system substrate-binding protein